MKKISRLKIDNEHFLIVFDNKSNSNYNRLVSIYHNKDTKHPLCGTILKETTSNEEYKNYGLDSLKRYYNQNSEIVL